MSPSHRSLLALGFVLAFAALGSCGDEAHELATAGKADAVDDGLCALGVLSRCPVPACPAAPPADDCAAYIERDDCSQCDFYRCREESATTPCGDDGYYLGFGYAYCQRYLAVTTPQLSERGRRFFADVRVCLMQAIEADVPTDATCDEVADAGLASHVGCYHASGFCELPLADWVAVLATIAPEDVQLREVLETGIGCL